MSSKLIDLTEVLSEALARRLQERLNQLPDHMFNDYQMKHLTIENANKVLSIFRPYFDVVYEGVDYNIVYNSLVTNSDEYKFVLVFWPVSPYIKNQMEIECIINRSLNPNGYAMVTVINNSNYKNCFYIVPEQIDTISKFNELVISLSTPFYNI